MEPNNNDNDKIACLILEGTYLKILNREMSLNYSENLDIFPLNWFEIDFEKKLKILGEAINKKIKVIDTEEYASLWE